MTIIMKRKGIIISVLSFILLAVPLFAVLNEKDLGQTLSVLRYELSREVVEIQKLQDKIETKDKDQHKQLVQMLKRCNELSLMLYSQKQDCTFDMTYALKEVTKQYDEFNSHRLPFDDMLERVDLEINRYSNLVDALEKLPVKQEIAAFMTDSLLQALLPSILDEPEPETEKVQSVKSPFVLDETGRLDRDSCLFYAKTLLDFYSESKARIIEDNSLYDDASQRLESSYEYAQNRYKQLQKKIFINGQENYFQILSRFGRSVSYAWDDCVAKYGKVGEDGEVLPQSEWRGPLVIGFLIILIVALVVSTFIGYFVIRLLSRYVKFLRREDIIAKMPCIYLLSGVVLFSLLISVVPLFLDNSFFAEASPMLLTLSWLIASICMSMFIRLDGEKIKYGLKVYRPLILLGIFVVSVRVMFIPNSLMNLILPPILVWAFFEQLSVCRQCKGLIPDSDMIPGWISVAVLGIASVASLTGYLFTGILIAIWWLFQVAAIETISAISSLLDMYYKTRIKTRIEASQPISSLNGKQTDGDYIHITWFYDLLKTAAFPAVAIWSVPFCILLSMQVFDLTDLWKTIVYEPFIHLTTDAGMAGFTVSIYMLIIAISLFFLFRYAGYVAKSIYRMLRVRQYIRSSGHEMVLSNEVNLTLANNVISIIVWGSYIIFTIYLLKIPTGAVSIVAAGLATGIGLAMKDILNNFIYGIQLMSGRLRVGDYIECDGVRGMVTEIGYQSTQIETVSGTVMSFLNTALFNKNFTNLTSNNPYEWIKVTVGVSYGSDIAKVRDIIKTAIEENIYNDSFGRPVLKPNYPIKIQVDDMADSSVNIAVKMYSLVPERSSYMALVKELIYETLNANGIEIPFPQRDIHIKAE